jgi:hypothetical protein
MENIWPQRAQKTQRMINNNVFIENDMKEKLAINIKNMNMLSTDKAA